MFKLIRRIFYFIIIFSLLGVLWGRFFNPIITVTQIEGWMEYGKINRQYISLDEMGSNVQKAVIASEDQNFFRHDGFDFKAIERAIKHNQNENKKTIQGGSTISQQTAKNIFLWNGRSWLRKGLEVGYTFAIEKLWSKDIILERYLNSIEMGQGVFGVEAAAQYYFHKSSKDLSKSEAAWIAVVLPNPKKYDPKNPTARLSRKHAWVMRQMRNVQL
ncbi:monofunctional biosynthetic peptidoglycan transglycosylase [Elizabethkingia sp. JS20170427COW]|uniref:monofunctional biosynthetic peptidoglycan transglycosylase n=1 Tax=Elizabethkingia sp. JS20170427COW TaxID=2583851 RepID=UPI001110EA79|nr:monofunctional biosynthetic peptidoglycan transglycosylase [Elizabethkingia sp. JS20170427COW]QCX53838.1 monofunctional biosynthetic peptidoglycan transglycosylase [Elizabethkingia sp. JS20170427COW]